MRVVDMDSDLVGKIIQRTVCAQMVCDNALKRCGDKEILLRETEQLALVVLIRGIIYNAYCHLNSMYVKVDYNGVTQQFEAKNKGFIPIIPSFSYTIKF